MKEPEKVLRRRNYGVFHLSESFPTGFCSLQGLFYKGRYFMKTELNLRRWNNPYSPKEKLKALNLLKRSDVRFVAHRYHCTVQTVYRWRRMYDGTLESLENKSHRPLSPHPNTQTDEEKKHIYDLIKRNPDIGLNELYGKLRLNYAYTRNPVTLYRFLRKSGFYDTKKKYSPYKPKPYDTPVHIGEKMQMDVKCVPKECIADSIINDERFYQYGIIDEATRERFIYPYREQNADSTIDFVRRAIAFFGYTPKIIQTDNGSEFTFTMKVKNGRKHSFDIFCEQYGIEHKLIKPRTPRHNGKIERSHRCDNERFYKYLRFHSYEDLKTQMKAYLKRSNNIPISTLCSSDKTKKWLTPNEKRKELLLLDWGVIE